MIYDIAGLRIDIRNARGYTERHCKDYLSPDGDSTADLVIEISKEELEYEKRLSAKQGGTRSEGYTENLAIYRKICKNLPLFDRFLLHAVIIGNGDKGFAFLGRSGAGKTTHSSLWLKYVNGSRIINGDKPIVRREGNRYRAYGTPWMGKENRGENSSILLYGACFIEQSPSNKIERLDEKETFARLLSQVLIPSDEKTAAETLSLMDGFIKNVPAYLLFCDISKEAALTSSRVLLGDDRISSNGGDSI